MIKSLSCADLAYYYAHEMKWKNGETEALLLKAKALDYLGNCKDALLIDLLALKSSIQLKDSILIARALRQTAGMYSTQSKINYSIKLYYASIEISRKINYLKGIGSALNDLGSIFFMISKYDQAIVLINESILTKIKIHDVVNLSNSYRKLSMIYFEIGLYEKSIDYILKSLKIANQINNQKQLSFAYYLLGMLYTSTKDYGKSLDYLNKSLKIKKKNHDNDEIGMIYTRIGGLFSQVHKLDSAQAYLRKANTIHKEVGDEYLISINNSEMGNLYLQMQNYDSANFYLKKSLKFDSSQNISQYLISDYLLLTKNSIQHKKYQEAQNYLQQAGKLIDSNATLLNQSNYSELQSLIYEKLNKGKEAFAAYKKFIVLRDSLLNKDKQTSIALKEARFDFDKKALADSLKNLEQQRAKDLQINFQQSELQSQKIKQYSLSAGLLLLAGIGWLLYSRYNAVNKQRLAEQQLLDYEKSRALENERSRIASEIHDDVGADLSNLLLKIRMKESLSQSAKTFDLESLKKTTHNIIHKIDEIIWSLNSKRDTLKELINFTSNYFETLLLEHNLIGKIQLPEQMPEFVLNTELRRNIFLTLKEIGNNALKYSKAKSFNLNFSILQNDLHITISDDGIGFDTNKTYNGNGIKNIKKRLDECNGSIDINSDATTGTTYKLIFPLIQNHPITVV
ncbi:MAG TPA: tetratricopeptide repeat protein [Bacteroidia bacterium]|nr:tetratricopeptide repeat protein [Bacteroidia bacterium]HRH09646.1 tetratricopeptide repeat protein [Bacteroidia bacterium]